MNDGKSKDANLKSLSKENNSLKSNLESLSLKLDELIYKSTSNPRKLIMQSKVDENKKKENIEQQIEIKKKELKNREQLLDILKKDKIKLTESWNRITNIGTDGKEQLKTKNKEIEDLQKSIKELKIVISEHSICEKKIKFLTKLVNNRRSKIKSKNIEMEKRGGQNNELNKKINMFDEALGKLEENKKIKKKEEETKKKKLRLKQKNYSLSLPNDYNNPKQTPLIKNVKDQIKDYAPTNPSNNGDVKSKMIQNNNIITNNNQDGKNKNVFYLKSASNKNKNIVYPFTEEEKKKAITVFAEEEIEIIKQMLNNKRFNALIEKLVVLNRFRNSKENQLKVKKRLNYQKIEKMYDNLDSLKKQVKNKEVYKKELSKKIEKFNLTNIIKKGRMVNCEGI